MSDFHAAMSPDDLDLRHQGELVVDEAPAPEPDDEGENDENE